MYAAVLQQGLDDAETREKTALPMGIVLEDESVELGTVAHGGVGERKFV